MLFVAGELFVERGCRRVRQLWGRRLNHGEDRAVAVEGGVELNVALAPIQLGRNQLVDIRIDFKMSGRIHAGHDRKTKRDQNGGRSKPCAGPNDRDNSFCQHFSFLSDVEGLAERPASSGVRPANLMLFFEFFSAEEAKKSPATCSKSAGSALCWRTYPEKRRAGRNQL